MSANQPPTDDDPYWLDQRDNRQRSHFGRQPSGRERGREDVVRDWYGDQLADAEIAARQAPAVCVKDGVEEVLKRLGLFRNLLLEDLRAQWESLVGKDIARRATPVAIYGSRLDIEVFESSWLYILDSMHKKAILAKVGAETDGKISEIRFVAGGRHAPPPRLPPPPARKR